MVFLLDWGITCLLDIPKKHYTILLSFWYKSDILVMVYRAQNKALRIINFKKERHPSAPLLYHTDKDT